MFGWLRRRFIAGFFVTVPLAVTVAAIVWTFRAVDSLTSGLYMDVLGRHVAGLGLLTTAAALLVIGIVATLEGMAVEGSAESLGRRVTASVVKSIFMVIVVDGLFAMFFAAIGM